MRSTTPSARSRIVALDGLRGVAAAIVVVYHYMCLLHWQATPYYGSDPPALSDTPLAIFWNGPFAVFVFFALSGFVMAAAAERRRDRPLTNAAFRYLRLAVPVTASVLLAWLWLTILPGAAEEMRTTAPDPSPWLRYTYHEGEIPGLHLALADGLVANFLRGFSYFNNVLWTMQIELLGSLMLFAVYWRAEGRRRLWTLAAAAAVIVFFFHPGYLAFVTGALLYEAWKGGHVGRMPAWTGAIALAMGVLLGAPGPGIDARLGLPDWPDLLRPGSRDGIWPVLAATCLLYAALVFVPFRALLECPLPQFLGRISFGLYLVHVPPLYTVVAAANLDGRLPEPVVAGLYLALVLGLAVIFTRAVDEPNLHALRALRGFALRSPGPRRPVRADEGRG